MLKRAMNGWSALIDTVISFPDLDRPVIHDIVYRHVEDAAFFWQQRDQATRARDAYREDIQTFDRKIQSHIRGVRAAGLAGWRVALEELEQLTAEGEMFVAASAALFLSQNEIYLQTLLDKITDKPSLKWGFLSACVWYDSKYVYPVLQRFFQSSSTQQHEIAVTACALRRINSSAHLLSALAQEETHIQARALRAVGELGLKQCQPQLMTSAFQNPRHPWF